MSRRLNKILHLILAITISVTVPVSTLAENGVTHVEQSYTSGDMTANYVLDARNAKVTTNVSSPNSTLGATGGGDVQHVINILTDVDLVQRTLINLDVAKFVNTSNTQKQDYKPDLKDALIEMVPEFKYADILEYEGFTKDVRDNLSVDTESTTDYASELEYLINKNIINRTTYYMYNKDLTYTSQSRVPNPAIGTIGRINPTRQPGTPVTSNSQNINAKDIINEEEDIEKYQNQNSLKHKYYDPDHKISKTDFLVELMKADKIEPSRPIITLSPYVRTDVNLNKAQINSEPIEQSPYASDLGKTGIDYASNDVVAWHDVFKQANILQTNDVVEYYIRDALNKNIVSNDDIGGVEGASFLQTTQTVLNHLKDGFLLQDQAIRQFYPNTLKLHTKIKEEDIVYPKDMDKTAEVDKTLINLDDTTAPGTLPPWGYSYYSNANNCVFANNFSTYPVELVKRPSVIEVQNNYWKYKAPESVDIAKETGYAYFKKEEITVAEAYILAYKLMLAMGSESKLTDTEINYLNSKYALNFSTFTAEERQATEYLIAKGIVDGGDKNLYTASSTSLTNKVAIDLIYRIANPTARISFNPQLSSVDKDMATQGFSQATISRIDDGSIFKPEVVDDITEGRKVYDSNGNEIKNSSSSYTTIQGKDRALNPSVYDLVYIRLPKDIYSSESDFNIGYCNLVTNDEFRVPISSTNKLNLNYGSNSTMIDGQWEEAKENMINGEQVAENASSPYIFKDADGYYWRRYLIHKSLSSKVELIAFTTKQSFTFTGIRGEGMYVIEDGVNTGSFRKVNLNDGDQYAITKRMHDVIVTADVNVRNIVSNEVSSNTFNDIGGFDQGNHVLWSQTAYMADNQNDTAKTSSILLTDPNLENYLYNGHQLFEKDGNGSYKIADDLGVPNNVRQCFKSVVKDANNGLYYLNYVSPYQNYITSAMQDVASKIEKIGSKAGSGNDVTVPGYAKIGSNGQTIAVITKDALTSTYGIEAKSEKMLYNPSTGQRAFFNTIDKTTMIGNNITKYPDGQLIVTAKGEGEGKILYYNLQAALELINDTSVVAKNAGAAIYTAIGDHSDALKRNYRLIDIKDVAKGTAQTEYTTIDRTYIESSTVGNSSAYYMNMSAMGGTASNFIYYKNKEKDLNVLLVYTPNVDNTKLCQYNGSAKAKVDNSLLKSTASQDQNSAVAANAQDTDKDGYLTKTMILKALVGTSTQQSISSLLEGPYNIDIYILTHQGDQNTLASKFSDFIDIVIDGDQLNVTTLKAGITRIDSAFKTGTFHDFTEKQQSTSSSNISIGKIETDTSILKNAEFVECQDSGNLYYKIYGKNSSNQLVSNTATLQTKLGTRFYYNTKSTAKTDDDTIYMRGKINYVNTGNNYIPLEMYSMPEYRNGLALANSNGSYQYNISKNIEPKLTSSDRTSASTNANIYIASCKDGSDDKKINDVGLATMVELKYRQLSQTQLKQLFAQNIFKNVDGSHAAFLNTFYNMTTDAFDQSFKSFNSNDAYSIKDAMGSGDKIHVSNGWDFSKSDTEKEQFFQGMWHITAKTSYYMPTQDNNYKDYTTYVLIVGNQASNNIAVKDAICYLGKVVNVGSSATCIQDIKAIRGFDDLPVRLQDFITTGQSSCLTSPPTESKGTNILTQVIDNSNGYKSKPIRIIYKPSLAIPAGTTLLGSSKGTADVDQFILAPNAPKESYMTSIRNLKFSAKDIVNTTLALAQEKDAIFLYQVPKGSRIILGDIDLLKYSNPDVSSSRLHWARCITTPTTTADGKTLVKQKRSNVSELSLLEKYMSEIYNAPIPIAGGAAKVGSIHIGEVVGPGAYRIPTATEAEYIYYSRSKQSVVSDLYKGLDKVFAFSVSENMSNMKGKNISYNPLVYTYVNDKLTVTDEEEASILLTLNLPPSLQVEMDPNMENTYRVVGYWDLNSFSVDSSEDMVAYLKNHDTDVISMDDILSDIKSQDLSGLPYLNSARDTQVKFNWDIFVVLVVIGIPSIALILWVIMAVGFVVFKYKKPRDIAENINQVVGKNIIGIVSLGMYQPKQEVPSFTRFMVASILLMLVLTVFWGKYIILWAASIIEFIRNR